MDGIDCFRSDVCLRVDCFACRMLFYLESSLATGSGFSTLRRFGKQPSALESIIRAQRFLAPCMTAPYPCGEAAKSILKSAI